MGRGQLQIAESVDPTAILDTYDVDHSGETVKRQVVALGGSADDALIEPTNAAPAADAYGLPVRVVETMTVKYAVVNLAASGSLVAAVIDKKIRVLSVFLLASGAVTFAFSTHSTGNISGVMQLATAAGMVLGWNPGGWFETVSGEALYGTLGGSIQVSGALSYIEV